MDEFQRTNWAPTGNHTGTLNDSAAEKTIGPGVWWVWATQSFKMSVFGVTGNGIGATPTVWPANFAVPVYVGTANKFITVLRAGSTNGTYYINRQFHQE
jgi:hypothetical protein